MVVSTELKIQLPPLHRGRDNISGQQLVADCPARFIVCICGRRWGKTVQGIHKCIKGALSKPNGMFWWVGPSHPEIMASRAWPLLKQLANQIPGCVVHEADRYISLPNGSEVWVKSADNPDSLRGPGLDGLVMDEAAQIKDETWSMREAPAPQLPRFTVWECAGMSFIVNT